VSVSQPPPTGFMLVDTVGTAPLYGGHYGSVKPNYPITPPGGQALRLLAFRGELRQRAVGGGKRLRKALWLSGR